MKTNTRVIVAHVRGVDSSIHRCVAAFCLKSLEESMQSFSIGLSVGGRLALICCLCAEH